MVSGSSVTFKPEQYMGLNTLNYLILLPSLAKILPKGANVRDNSAPKPVAVESRDHFKTNLEQINEKKA